MQSDLLRGEPDGIIGVDEAGKGDYFGPLVIASCYSNKLIEQKFEAIGLKESKAVTDKRAFLLESEIKKIAPFEVIAIGPEKYNELYDKIKNLNKLLAWGHARAIENLLEKTNPIEVIADQFGDERLIQNALMKKGRSVNLNQQTKAERFPAVAAASILARAEFLRRLEKLSEIYKIHLPKGAGTQVDDAGRIFAKSKGTEELSKIAKIHFKNTKRVIV